MTAQVVPESAVGAAPKLREVLKSGDSLFKKRLLAFLQEEQCDESILFWDDAENFSKQVDETLKMAVIETFVRPGAPKEINIDAFVREEVLKNSSSTKADLFTPAQQEVEVLLEQDSFPRFLEEVSKHNIGKRVALYRIIAGIALVLLVVLASALMVHFGFFQRFFRLIFLPFFFVASSFFVVATCRM